MPAGVPEARSDGRVVRRGARAAARLRVDAGVARARTAMGAVKADMRIGFQVTVRTCHTDMHVKVACVQMSPVLGQPQESMAIASRLLEPYTVDSGPFFLSEGDGRAVLLCA